MALALAKFYMPRMYVAIEGIDAQLPAIRFNATFELNTIPQASVSIPVGNEFRTHQPASVHQVATQLGQRRRRCQVMLWMQPVIPGAPDLPADLGIPQGSFRIFDGWTAAVGFSVTNGAAQYNIQLDHWLSDMNFSSVFSKTSHPSNRAEYTFGALSGGGCEGGETINWSGVTHTSSFFTADHIESDLWLDAIKPWFTCLCNQDAFEARERNLLGRGKNDAALAALRRIKDGTGYVPLAPDLAFDADLSGVLSDDAAQMTQNPGDNAQVTIWDTLVGKFAAQYLFAVVPLVDRAMVVPFIPGYRAAYKTIPPAHQTQVEWTNVISRRLRGMGVLSGLTMDTGAGDGPPNRDQQDGSSGIGGYYAPNDDTGDGQVIIKAGPSWCGRLFRASNYPDESSGGDGKPIADAMAPGVARPGRRAAVAARRAPVRRFLDRYAQALYALEMVRGRQAIAAGPLRFDVAPGSTILVYPTGNQFAPGDQLAAPFYASVVRVSMHLDAEALQVGTGFHLAHCRGEQENTSDATSIAGHPLYKGTFLGCGLLD
jgi:hypothetical protein